MNDPDGDPSLARPAQSAFAFEGRPIFFQPGQTVAAALMAAGEVVLRHSESGEPRGALCCIGVCWECRLVINGRPNTRACTVLAEVGMVARMQKGLA